MSAKPICLVGLPGAGKTTFLAALWAALRDGSSNGRYKVAEWPETSEYLQRIADEWFEARPVERNASTSFEPIELSVRSSEGETLVVRLPDLSGEAFRDAAADRHIDRRVATLVGESGLVLFFVNAATASTAVSLADLPGEASDAAEGPEVEFDAKALETDILNAELLQLLPLLAPRPERPPPLVVIVSAWDMFDAHGMSPSEWLRTHQPMFSQVVDEYARSSRLAIMGVSAQGADYSSDVTVAQKAPADRPLVVFDESRSTDVGTPLGWFSDHEGPSDGT